MSNNKNKTIFTLLAVFAAAVFNTKGDGRARPQHKGIFLVQIKTGYYLDKRGLGNKAMTTKLMIAPGVLLLLSVMVIQPVMATPFTCDKSGCHDDVVSTGPTTSKAESASAAHSQNNVRCFAFCLGVSTANSGSAANSDSRANSPFGGRLKAI